MDDHKNAKTDDLEINQRRKPSDWVEQTEPLNDQKQAETSRNVVGDNSEYDATSEEIIAAHDSSSQQEGVDEEWSGDAAENKDFAAADDDELA